jgi:hypothetical protein
MVRLAHSDVLFDAELAAFRLTARNASCLSLNCPKELTILMFGPVDQGDWGQL